MQPQRSASWGTGQGKEVQGADEGTREGEENNKTCFDWLSICPPLKKKKYLGWLGNFQLATDLSTPNYVTVQLAWFNRFPAGPCRQLNL